MRRRSMTPAIAQWVAEEGASLGVSSGGELTTALIAGVDPNQILLLLLERSPWLTRQIHALQRNCTRQRTATARGLP